ncbi:MAG: c-type cytochrome [Burkholderiaceae bacterium]
MRLILALTLLSLALPAAAQNKPSQVAWNLVTVKQIGAGDAVRGKTLHAPCAGCHGDNGISPSPQFPDLAGQDALYTYKQLHDYQSGARPNAIMQSFVSALSPRDMADLAAFYAAQPRAAATIKPIDNPTVMQLVKLGDGGRMIVGCDYCHGTRGAGNPGMYGMPALAAQKGEYLQQMLEYFHTGERHNDTYRAMRATVKRLSSTEIAGLAAYYSATPVAPRALPGATPAQPAAAIAAPTAAPAAPAATAGPGWYTEVQASQGATLFAANCAMCHGAKLGGGMGPALIGRPFWRAWGAKPFSQVWHEVHAKMPMQAPGSKSTPVSIDILAFILKSNGVAAGKTTLNDTTDLSKTLPAR